MERGVPVHMVAWGDAAWANRPDNVGSTEGIIIGLATQSLIDGKLAPVSILGWRSAKIDPPRHLRSLSNDAIAALTPGLVITDSENLYDK